MKTFIPIIVLILTSIMSGNANATLYLGPNLKSVLASSVLIAQTTVIENLETSRSGQSCLVYVDKVLSGTLTDETIQIYRNYIRMGLPRDDYRPSETLIFCLESPVRYNQALPRYSQDTPQFDVVGSNGEGEFPLVKNVVFVRVRYGFNSVKTRYANEDFQAIRMPLSRFSQLIDYLKNLTYDQWPDKKMWVPFVKNGAKLQTDAPY